MKAFVFPGQGSQFPGMGHNLYKSNKKVKSLFNEADDVLGFALSNVMFNGNDEELKQTKITQPAIFLHSIAELIVLQETHSPSAVAGHSLGEFSSLVANNTISFEDGLKLVFLRSKAMQKSCENSNGTMAAILGLDDKIIKETCESFDGNVTAANFNCPGQVVISGELNAVKKICEKFNEIGARRSILLHVGGAFHSNLMNDAKSELKEAIHKTKFNNPSCPIYQNFTAKKTTNIEIIKENLINQLTAPVLWTQTINNMVNDGYLDYMEVGPGRILQGLIRKVNREVSVESALG
jgi:[acyl-carrier-protein] S-malonyltransferase